MAPAFDRDMAPTPAVGSQNRAPPASGERGQSVEPPVTTSRDGSGLEDADGNVAGYALFWFDNRTGVGLLEPMRVEDDYQRRGLARMLLTTGLDRLAGKGARRLKVGFSSEAARSLYVGAGFVQKSVNRSLVRPAAHEQGSPDTS
jgi:GNAT superfamily N-acetyltransferase